jgi:G:T-mismatch repair DNA endonuclease (very short patch repair protein)/acetolactate synthase regulatory subunit
VDGWKVVERLGQRQWGLVSAEQLANCGVESTALRWKLDSGRIERVHFGVYRFAAVPVTWHQRALAAALAGGPSSALSFASAAHAHELDGFEAAPAAVDLTTPRRQQRRLLDVVLHRSNTRLEVTRRRGLPVTGVARTLVDLAAVLDDERLELTLDSAHRKIPKLASQLCALLDEARRSGARRLRRLLEERLAPTDSALELKVRRILRRARMPRPAHQLEVSDLAGPIVRIDFAWPAERVALHVDGYRWHHQRDRFERDRVQLARLTALGWRSVHVTSRSAGDLAWLAALRSALQAGALQLRLY